VAGSRVVRVFTGERVGAWRGAALVELLHVDLEKYHFWASFAEKPE